MRITLSKNMSYCFGVKRTLTLVEELVQKNPDKQYYMLGEIIHNEYVINSLKAKGLQMISDLDEIKKKGIVIIQSHGTPQKTIAELREKNIDYIDATCPMVKKIHEEIRKLEKQGYFPVIIGRKGHEEVNGIAGQVKQALIFGKTSEVLPELFKGREKVGIVVQSTYIRDEALAILKKIEALISETKFVNTICRPTTDRQNEVKNIAGKYDFVLIVGSKTSANTKHLYKLASGSKSNVYLVDDPKDAASLQIPKDSSVFIASGASTPMSWIEEVVMHITTRKISTNKKVSHAQN